MPENARKRPYYRTPKINRPDITVGGVTWTPRARFADELKLAENTIRSWNLQTVYPGGIAHVRREEGLRHAVGQRRRRDGSGARPAPGAGTNAATISNSHP
jgi:hypothetical protein